MDKKPFTVISCYESTGQIVCDHVLAESGLNAFSVAANERGGDADLSFVVAIPGHMSEADNELAFPGEGLVDAETVLEQSDAFGKAA